MTAYADALDPQHDPAHQSPIWGNADVLVTQWREVLGAQGSEALLMGIRIRRIGMLLDKIIIAECDQADVKHHEFILLMALRRIGEPYALRPTDILRMHSVTSGTATYRLDQLSKRNLVERIPDPHDRRSFLIGLTPHGKDVVDGILGRMRVAFDAQLARFRQVPGGFSVLEAGLRLFEDCILDAPAPAPVAAPAP
ncbi:MAG: MarR family winged helix-turn-helix transcriptional regulator, partial [Aquincola tertiaricarbonis]